jgi:alkanesulfonate monooxygenase
MTDVQIFTTCPQSKDHAQQEYRNRVIEVSKWSDEAGCTGMLIYADNSIIDPWLVAQIVIRETKQLAPLVAVQPVYMHPYSVAKMVASLGFLYLRPIWLNMIAGGFKNDLIAMGDPTEHDQRYARLIEYCQIIQLLLAGDKLTYDGAFYQVRGLAMTPPLLPRLAPKVLMSGSSPASRAAAATLDAIAVEYPEPLAADQPSEKVSNRGIRVGIIADDDTDKAWQIAHERFPPDRRGQLQHAMAIRASDSSWQRRLGTLAQEEHQGPYWLWPFKNYSTFCPYLVGDYDTVSQEIARYLNLGYETFILDIPRSQRDLVVAREVFRRAGAA